MKIGSIYSPHETPYHTTLMCKMMIVTSIDKLCTNIPNTFNKWLLWPFITTSHKIIHTTTDLPSNYLTLHATSWLQLFSYSYDWLMRTSKTWGHCTGDGCMCDSATPSTRPNTSYLQTHEEIKWNSSGTQLQVLVSGCISHRQQNHSYSYFSMHVS